RESTVPPIGPTRGARKNACSGRGRDPAVTCHGRRRRLLRDLHDEGRAGGSVRFDPDSAVDPAYELPADVEAEPGAADAAAHVRIEAVELLEDPPLLARGDTEAGVRDREADVAVVRLERDLDRTTLRRILDRVLDQVRDHLPELPRVGRHRSQLVRSCE